MLFCCILFFNGTATTEIYTYLHTLSLHDALPISCERSRSVSSIRSRKRPPCFLAHSQLWSAVRTLPTCRWPVGEGAKRVIVVMAGAYSRFVATVGIRVHAEKRRGLEPRAAPSLRSLRDSRSEESRVGKECFSTGRI